MGGGDDPEIVIYIHGCFRLTRTMHVWIGACLEGMLQGKFRDVFRLSCVGTWILTKGTLWGYV